LDLFSLRLTISGHHFSLLFHYKNGVFSNTCFYIPLTTVHCLAWIDSVITILKLEFLSKVICTQITVFVAGKFVDLSGFKNWTSILVLNCLVFARKCLINSIITKPLKVAEGDNNFADIEAYLIYVHT